MSESTNHASVPTTDNQTATLTLLDDPEFRKGFIDGQDAYFDEIGGLGHLMTIRRFCQEIRRELNPKLYQNDRILCNFKGWPLMSQTYQIGFLTGWVAAHTSQVHTNIFSKL